MSNLSKPIEWFVGRRYTKLRREGHRVSLISLIPTLGIAAGVMVLITVLSVMNGFEHAMRDRILGMVSHIMVSSTATGTLANWSEKRETLLAFPHVTGAAPYIQKEVMLSRSSEVRGIALHGVLPELQKTVGHIDKHITEGQFDALQAGKFGIILGETLAKDLKLKIGDEVTVISPKSFSINLGESPTLRSFTLLATFKLDMKMYDSAVAFIHMHDASTMLDMNESVNGIRLQLDDLYHAPTVRSDILRKLPPETWALDWTQLNANFFKAIRMQKTVMFFILIMLIAVAAFNLVSTLVMVVTDKESDIAILKTLGVSSQKIMRIFMIQGLLIGIIGTLIGIIVGVFLSLNIEHIVPVIEQLLGLKLISEDVYFISKIKGILHTHDIVTIATATILLAILSTLYPSWKASRIQPAESLRYE